MTKLAIFKKLTIVLVVVILLSISGVYANWVYPMSMLSNYTMTITPRAFKWEGSDVLPDDDQNAIGENHIVLLENILFEANYGLNADKKPIIHNLLNNAGDVVYCQQNVKGGNLKHLMIDNTDAFSLLFQVEYVSDSEYVIYTYSAPLIREASVGDYIEVFITTAKIDGDGIWQAVSSSVGEAKVISPGGKVPKAIDSATFTSK